MSVLENFEKWPLLGAINSPADLKAMPKKDIPLLASEMRDYLVYRVSENGGHLASNLGVVELTLALHRVFDSPRDHILFDVGHQSYIHKLLTGRKEQFDSLRTVGGLSGFTKRSESEHDPFGAGHSSTAISAALGLARAEKMKGSDAYTVAVVGDGALTGGLSYEALNNCDPTLRLIIVINENEMSISPNTGQLARHLGKIRTSHKYLKIKEFTSSALRHVPLIGKPIYLLLRGIKRLLKRLVYRDNLFEHMGIRYLGPVEGQDVENIEDCLAHARKIGGCVILHLKTKKGKGYAPAEQDPNTYHALSPAGCQRTGDNFSAIFGKALCDLAATDDRICAITAAMSCGTGLEPFRTAYPDRFFDVGIAEGHAVTFAAGLAAGEKRPVVALYSTFLQRAYDNVLHDAALQRLPLVLCIDRAGFNCGDGATHHGVFDISMLSAIPDIVVYAPVTREGVKASLSAALARGGVCAVRYPNGGENEAVKNAFYPTGVAETDAPRVRIWGDDAAQVTIVTHGRITAEALTAAHRLADAGIPVRVLLCEYLAPYATLSDEIAPLLRGAVIFLEEEVRAGGFGMNLSDALARKGALHTPFAILAADNGFLTPVAGETYYAAAGVDADAVVTTAKTLCNKGETTC